MKTPDTTTNHVDSLIQSDGTVLIPEQLPPISWEDLYAFIKELPAEVLGPIVNFFKDTAVESGKKAIPIVFFVLILLYVVSTTLVPNGSGGVTFDLQPLPTATEPYLSGQSPVVIATVIPTHTPEISTAPIYTLTRLKERVVITLQNGFTYEIEYDSLIEREGEDWLERARNNTAIVNIRRVGNNSSNTFQGVDIDEGNYAKPQDFDGVILYFILMPDDSIEIWDRNVWYSKR